MQTQRRLETVNQFTVFDTRSQLFVLFDFRNGKINRHDLSNIPMFAARSTCEEAVRQLEALGLDMSACTLRLFGADFTGALDD